MTRTFLASSTSSSTGGNVNACGSMAVDSTSVYVLVGQQSGNMVTYLIGRALIGQADQTIDMLGSAVSYNGSQTSPLVVNSTSVIFETQSANGSQAFQITPLGGGPMTTRPIDLNTFGRVAPFVADDTNIYAVAGGCPCNDNGNMSYQGPPPGVVAKVPIQGGPSITLATISGDVSDVAIDATNVYWSTDTTAWKIPIAGGTATTVAGNLTNGAAAYQCNGCGSSSQNQSTTLAVGSSELYIAVTSATEAALLEVSK
jgi:hypothetical protein